MTIDEIKQLRGRQLFLKDEHLWLVQQIQAIENGDPSKLDRRSLAEFLGDVLARDRREFESHLMALLFLLLLFKLDRKSFKEKEVCELLKQQDSIRNFLRLSPSLEVEASNLIVSAYAEAAYQVEHELRMIADSTPRESPWTFDEALSFDPPVILD